MHHSVSYLASVLHGSAPCFIRLTSGMATTVFYWLWPVMGLAAVMTENGRFSGCAFATSTTHIPVLLARRMAESLCAAIREYFIENCIKIMNKDP